MKDLLEAIKGYILKTLGLQIDPVLWRAKSNLPIFLKNRYILYVLSILDKSYLLAVASEPEESSPAQIAKHLEQMQNSPSLDLKAFGLKNMHFNEVLATLGQVYGLI